MTAVVVQEGSSPDSNTTKVQVQLADRDSQNALSVFVDGTFLDFSSPLSTSKEFYSTFTKYTKWFISGRSDIISIATIATKILWQNPIFYDTDNIHKLGEKSYPNTSC